MCGIAGIVNLGNAAPIRSELLRDMADAMSHRGPDGFGVWVKEDGQVGFSHRRLAIIDLSDAGKQPMSTADGLVWITFNGEIYNFQSLRRALEGKGYTFRSQSDTEVILYLYRHYGADFYERLDGDFAIALWDSAVQELFLVRDRAGVKPLYYTEHDGRLLFASEIKGLLRYPGMRAEVDERSLYHYLSFLVVPAPETLISGIRKLPAATLMRIRLNAAADLAPRKYWEPFPRVSSGTRDYSHLDEELESLFRASVKKRMIADVPVGVLFSGGVDSTLNLAAFSELSHAPVKTFTVGMANGGDFHDDSSIARRMARQFGSDHHEIQITEHDLLNVAPKLAQLQDEPISDPVAVPLYFVTRLAREQGVTVLQAGEGADELFCGYSNYRRFMRAGRLWSWAKHVPEFATGAAGRLLARVQSPRVLKISDALIRHSKQQELFMSSAIAYYEQEKLGILCDEFVVRNKGLDSFSAVLPFYDRLRTEVKSLTTLQAITFIELQLRLPELLLMRADKMAMANSVEIRVPFLDRDLLDFALRVPDSYKLRNGISKEPIKRLAATCVPTGDMYRRKTGFGVPIQQWFKGTLGRSLLDFLEDERGIASDIFSIQELRQRVKDGARTVNEAFQLWVVYNFLVWVRAIRARSLKRG